MFETLPKDLRGYKQHFSGKPFQNIGSVKENIQLSNIYSFAFCPKIIETNQMSANIYSSKLVIDFKNV